MNHTFWHVVFLAGLLSVATVAFLGWDGRYAVVSGDILPNAGFERGFDSWNGTPRGVALSNTTPRLLRIQADDGGRTPLVTQIVRDLAGISHLRVTVDIRTEDVVAGKEFWHRAGVFLYSVSRSNRRLWYWPYEIARIEGTSDWRHHSAIIPVSADAAYMQLFLFNAGEAGRMYARNLTVDSVTGHGLARVLRWGLIGAWIVFAGGVLVVLLRRRLTVLSIVTCGGAIAIVLSLVWPQPDLKNMQGAALQAANTAIIALQSYPTGVDEPVTTQTVDGAAPGGTGSPGDKERGAKSGALSRGQANKDGTGARIVVGPLESASFSLFGLDSTTSAHLSVFVVLAVFARLAFRGSDSAYVLVALTAFAVAAEVIQGFTITRTVELEDGVYNVFGAIIGLLTTSIFVAVVSSIRRR